MNDESQSRNNLLNMRKKRGLGQKQVAVLLGHKTIDSISRYEKGLITPNLANAFKLGLIYQAPLHLLFEGYFETCRQELMKRGRPEQQEAAFPGENRQIPADFGEFCTFATDLKKNGRDTSVSENVRRHIAELIKLRSEELEH